MKIRLIASLLILVLTTVCLWAAPREAAWADVDEAINRGLPRTAIERLDSIIAAAKAEHADAEATRAICRKIALQGVINGNKPEEKIVCLQAEIEKAPAAMRPAMEAILAHWYWQYFQHNRWRFLQRTQTATAPGADIQTWDLARILAEIGKHFDAALADTAIVQSTPIGTLDALVAGGTVPDFYRPTLFDFLTYEALSFYQTGEQGATVAEDAFELDAASPIFGDTDEFLAWKPFDAAHGGPATSDTASPKSKAVALYQALLRFHAQDADRSAFLDADLARLNYGFNVATGDDKLARYRGAVTRFAESAQLAGHEIAARAWADLAEHLPEPAEAHAMAERGLAAFPAGNGAARCFNLIQSLEAKSARLETEMVWSPAGATLDITYKNVAKVFFRAVAVDFDDTLNDGFDLGKDEIRALLGKKPALAWEADLAPTPDFKEHTEKLLAPQSLKPGLYVVIAGHRSDFGDEDNQISTAMVWVSNLALVLRDRRDGPDDGFVVRADSGEPVAGATVRFLIEAYGDRYGELAPSTTDADGRFRFPSPKLDGRPALVVAEYGGQRVSSVGPRYLRKRENRASPPQSRTTFFTDRAIYRPGQTINYKGIAVRYDQSAGRYEAAIRKNIVVVFIDPNGKEIARAEHKTNDYGSFSGVFTAPRDRATGQMAIRVEGPLGGATWFSVEEYKRPKFQVEITPPAEAPELDAAVTVTGRAAAYTGAAVGGAKVQWRVERTARVPRWCWWFRPPESKAIAHGVTTTADDGSFQIEFVAAPDRAVPVKNEPVFTYTIHAAVTDTTGETRTESREVRVGYTALQAAIMVADWQTPETPVAFTLATTTLNDVPQAASGSLKVYALRQPVAVMRTALTTSRWWSSEEPKPDPANPETWELGAVVAERTFTTEEKGGVRIEVQLAPGLYRAVVETQDRFAQKVTTRRLVEVVDPAAKHYGVKVPEVFIASNASAEPGETFVGLWGTGYPSGRALVEVECAGRLLQRYWTRSGQTQELIKQAVTEEMRGGFTVRVLYVRENRIYIKEARVTVPWTNKQLTVKWETFRSKLMPGQKETWTAVVEGPDAKGASAEMVATLYDASLDQFRAFEWPRTFDVFRGEVGMVGAALQNRAVGFDDAWCYWEKYHRPVVWLYRRFGVDVLSDLWGAQYAKLLPPAPVTADEEVVVMSPFEVNAEAATGYRAATTLAGNRISTQLYDVGSAVTVVTGEFLRDTGATDNASLLQYTAGPEVGGATAGPSARPKPDLTKVTARKNLNETAFFFPHLTTDKDGVVRMTFTMPEALTEWKFLGFAHDAQLRAGGLIDTVVTAKDLMVQPNPPRFVREGDAIEFTVKISNQSDRPQRGTVKLTFADAATLAPADAALGNTATEQSFDVPAKQSRSYSWRIAVPDGLGFLTYKAVAATQQASDGEEGFLPVLSRRILVTESLPLPIRGKSTKSFAFQKLLDSGKSDTLRHQSLTVQMTSQPAWYAVMALPYLLEFPYECSEQVFSRLYANALARHIANSDPKIRRVFDLWKNTPALDSPLTQNQDLKSVLLEETPWVREAQRESEARRNVGVLFDANRLDEATARTLRKLTDQQLEGGLWPWFPGGQPSEYISLYLVTGFGRLRHLGVTIDTTPAVKALAGLDAWMAKRHAEILRGSDPDSHVPSHLESIYLYGRSFFLAERPIASQHRAAVDFFLARARQHWLRTDCRMCQGQLALALLRFGDKETPRAILASLKERSVVDEELGMFWRDTELSWWWYRAPIETQATMIEAFAEVGGDQRAVDDCQVWLLKQKQTQDWKTTKATADAIYALLLGGRNLLASDALVEVALGGTAIKPAKAEAGTGFFEQKFSGAEIKPAMGQVTVKKVDDGVSWGSMHWQYLEDLAKVTPHEGTPLKLKKSLWVKQTTKKGQELVPVTGPIAVGDELVVRIELRTDRDMEFVHLKDQRGSGTEPVNVISQYKYQDGLAYYESTRDTASHFFIDYLPRGTYVFEYSTRVQLKGAYQTGIAEIQCMYAPEFNSHSESIPLEVK